MPDFKLTDVNQVILLNILIALYNSAYEDIYDNADDEYLALFSQKTMQFVRAPDENVYIAPFNLIEIVISALFEWWMSKKTYEFINDCVMGFLYSPLLLITAFFETRTAYAIRRNRARGEADDDIIEEWEQLAHEIDFGAEGWAKKCEAVKPNLEDDPAVLEVKKLRAEIADLKSLLSDISDHVHFPPSQDTKIDDGSAYDDFKASSEATHEGTDSAMRPARDVVYEPAGTSSDAGAQASGSGLEELIEPVEESAAPVKPFASDEPTTPAEESTDPFQEVPKDEDTPSKAPEGAPFQVSGDATFETSEEAPSKAPEDLLSDDPEAAPFKAPEGAPLEAPAYVPFAAPEDFSPETPEGVSSKAPEDAPFQTSEGTSSKAPEYETPGRFERADTEEPEAEDASPDTPPSGDAEVEEGAQPSQQAKPKRKRRKNRKKSQGGTGGAGAGPSGTS